MKLPKLPSIAYQDKEGSKPTFAQKAKDLSIAVAIIPLASIPVMYVAIWGEVALFVLVFSIMVLILILQPPADRISLGPRYMTCGKKIVYYRNINKLEVHEQQGYILISYGSGQSLKILRENFPTKARKADKIRINQQAKFLKLKEKVLSRVRYFAPQAQLVGVNHNE